MLQLATTCKDTRLSASNSRIPILQFKRTRSFKMSDKRQLKSTNNDFLTKSTKYSKETNRALGITDSEKGRVASIFERNGGILQQRNIETEVFDWLSKKSEKSDKYTGAGCCLENNTNVCGISTEDFQTTASSYAASEDSEEISEKKTEMAKRGNDMGTKSYFSAIKNVIFPFEGKYFYLSGELHNHKVSLTETAKIIGDNSGHLMDKTSRTDEKYKEILGDKRGEKETKKNNKRWENSGLKDTKVYHEDQRIHSEDKNGYVGYKYGYNNSQENMAPLMKINLKSDYFSENQQKEINRLRAQIEKLSTFVETSDERREQSEILLAQQKEELLKQIREKEMLENRVCCLEELRRNLQRKVDEISEENESVKIALKSNEEKLIEEKESVKVLKKECSNEIAKNAELELVLQTIREELGCPAPKSHNPSDSSLGTRKSYGDLERDWGETRVVERRPLDETRPKPHQGHVEKKVTWSNVTVEPQEIKKSSRPVESHAETHQWGLSTRTGKSTKPDAQTVHAPKIQYSCLKHHTNDETKWKREKKQFEGKIMLLEMDKKKLRSQIDLLEEKITKQESIGQKLRENNEILEFRILELEYELSEKTNKQ